MSAARIERAAVWQALGEPSDQVGSANDPRVREEQGLRWNEKWIYRARGGPDSGDVRRIVLWHRLDFVGAFRVGPDGRLTPDPEPLDAASRAAASDG